MKRGEDGSQELWGNIKKQVSEPMGVKKDMNASRVENFPTGRLHTHRDRIS